MQKVILVQDDSSHWYVIPSYLHEEFYADVENEDFVDSGRFDEKYGKFRTGGSPNNIQLYAEI